MSEAILYRRWEGPIEAAAQPLLALYRAVFDDVVDSYLLDRLAGLDDPDLWIAEGDGEWVGFKLAYRRGPGLLYSWLGGVRSTYRGRGIASALTVLQHDHARVRGYAHVETRTRAPNNAMIQVNLRHGFQICGFEVDARGIAMVLQRKAL